MGKTQSMPQTEREPIRTGHEITIPVHISCASRPSMNKSFDITVTYSVDTVLYDVLQQIENEIGGGSKLKISSVSKRSFLRHRIALNQSKENRSRLRALQYRSITSYSEKTIRREGVHCEVEMERKPLQTINNNQNQNRPQSGNRPQSYSKALKSNQNKNGSKSTKSSKSGTPSEREPLSKLTNSMKSMNASKGSGGTKTGDLNTKNGINALRNRLQTLTVTSDTAYCHYDDLMVDLHRRECGRLKFMKTLHGNVTGYSSGGSAVSQSVAVNDCGEALWGGLSWRMREVLLDWFFDLAVDLKLEDETCFAAIHYLDLYLGRRQIARRDLQLLGVTCCMMASKTYEIIPQPMSEWLYLSHDQYGRKQMINLERNVLQCIDWNVFQVTPPCYITPWMQMLALDATSDPKKTSSKTRTILGVQNQNNDDQMYAEGPSYRFLVALTVRCAAMTTEYLKTPSKVMAAVAMVLSFLYLRDDAEGESSESKMNRAASKGTPYGGCGAVPLCRWKKMSAESQRPKLELLAAASKLDFESLEFHQMLHTVDRRVFRLLKEADSDPGVCALYRSFTDAVRMQKRMGHSMDIKTLGILKRKRPLRM